MATQQGTADDQADGMQGIGADTALPPACWSNMPEIVLAHIFSSLPILDRMTVSQVCSTWYMASGHPLVWRHFVYGECYQGSVPQSQREEMVKQLHSQRKQYFYIIDTYGEKFSQVSIVLYDRESLDMLSKLTEVCCSLKNCSVQVHSAMKLEYSNIVSQFLSICVDAEEIQLKNVEFIGNEQKLPFPIGLAHMKCLRSLSLVNSFRGQSNLSSLMYLVNLVRLTIMPHHLRFTWLDHLANAALRTLNIVNMVGAWKFDFPHLSEEAWRKIGQHTRLQVNCYLVDLYNSSKLLCPTMPLTTLVCCQTCNLQFSRLRHVLMQYSQTLTTFVYFSRQERSYHVKPLQADDHVLAIAQHCPKLRTLAIKDCLNSSTLLLIVQLNSHLQDPIIHEGMIHYELHVPSDMVLSQEMLDFTTENYPRDKFKSAMSQLLKRDWRPLPKEEYFRFLLGQYSNW